jgi:hypothetical protein
MRAIQSKPMIQDRLCILLPSQCDRNFLFVCRQATQKLSLGVIFLSRAFLAFGLTNQVTDEHILPQFIPQPVRTAVVSKKP